MLTVRNVEWLAGFFDAEACFYFNVNACRIQVAQKDPWPLLKIQQMVGGRIYQYQAGPHNTTYNVLMIVGRKAVGVMMTVYPLMSPRRQQKILANLMRWKAQRLKTDLKNTTHCRHGHEYTPETTYFHPKKHKRECRICVNASREKYEAKKMKLVAVA